MYQYHAYQDVKAFKNIVIPYLEQKEAMNNLALGILMKLQRQDSPLLMGIITKNYKQYITLLQTHPRQIILSLCSEIQQADIEEISTLIHHSVERIPGFIGEKELVLNLATKIAAIRKLRIEVGMDQRIYELDEVKKFPTNNGRFVWLTNEHLPIVSEWIDDFCKEINDPIDSSLAQQKAMELLENKRLAGWEKDGTIVSIANATRPTKHNITINMVYTPLKFRKKGYASNCVSALTTKMLERGFKTTSLYTDITNPTSNKIYIDIGFKPIVNSMLIYLKTYLN